MPDKLISELELTENPSPTGDIPFSQDGETYRVHPEDLPVSNPTQAALDEKADVTSLGAAAFSDAGGFATAEQGAKADSAVQPDEIIGLQESLNDKAEDSEVVHTAGNETISGTKTFSASPILPAGANGLGLLGLSGATHIFSLLRQASPANGSLVLSTFGGFAIATNRSSPATSGFSVQIDSSGNITVSGALNTIAGGAAGAGTQTLASTAYIQSRGQNLLTNGFGNLRNNYNFSQFVFDPIQLFAGNGSFKRTGTLTGLTDELIPVDPNAMYEQVCYVKESTGVVGTRFYLGIAPVDADGLAITASHHLRQAGTDTTLAADLKPGDTIVHLTSAANWNNAAGGTTYQRSILMFGHTNTAGYVYPPYTYSRRFVTNAYADGGINFGTNTITLSSPWPATWGTIPAGTAISNGSAGATYKYVAATGATATNDWTRWSGKIGGVDYSGENKSFVFPPGTANVRMLILPNYQTGTSGGTQNFSGFSFGIKPEQPAVQSTATATSVFPDTGVADTYAFTALASALTINAPVGLLTDGDTLRFRIQDDGTPRALSWNGAYRAIGVTLPTTTTANKVLYVDAVFNAHSGTWDVLQVRERV